MLSEREVEALERYRSREFHYADVECDRQALALAMLRLYPPGWNEPVTPERLVELGFETHVIDDFDPKFYYELSLSCRPRISEWIVYTPGWSTELPDCLVPRNMGEVRQLLERCGAIKETK